MDAVIYVWQSKDNFRESVHSQDWTDSLTLAVSAFTLWAISSALICMFLMKSPWVRFALYLQMKGSRLFIMQCADNSVSLSGCHICT